MFLLKKLKNTNKQYIEEKLKTYNTKKEERIEILADKITEQENEKHPFTPVLVTQPKENRDLETFLKTQKDFIEKVDKKKITIKESEDAKLTKTLQEKPEIDKNSKQIISEINNSSEPVHERLYNKMNEKKLVQQEEPKSVKF